jgi:hypothetical protein
MQTPPKDPRKLSRVMCWASLFLAFMAVPLLLALLLEWDPTVKSVDFFGPVIWGALVAASGIWCLFFATVAVSGRNPFYRVDAAAERFRIKAEADRERLRRIRGRP